MGTLAEKQTFEDVRHLTHIPTANSSCSELPPDHVWMVPLENSSTLKQYFEVPTATSL